MSRDLYRQRIEEFCLCMGMEPDTARLLESGLLSFDGMDVRIHYSASGGAAYRLHIDLGMPPDESASKVHEIMLEQNFQNEDDAGFIFSRHPDSRHLVVTVRTALDSIADGAQLAAWIDEQIARSDAWSENVLRAVSRDSAAASVSLQGFV